MNKGMTQHNTADLNIHNAYNVAARGHLSGLCVPNMLYDQMVTLYRWSQKLARDLNKIMESNEHAMLMREGGRLGYVLPLPDFLYGDLKVLQKHLSQGHPFYVRPSKRYPDHVHMPIQMLRQLNSIFKQDRRIVTKMHNLFETTDYLDYFTYLKHVACQPYTGPHCLDSFIQLYARLMFFDKSLEQQVRAKNIHNQWRKLID